MAYSVCTYRRLPSDHATIYRLIVDSQWNNAVSVVLHSAFTRCLARAGYIHACELVTICLAWSSSTQAPITNEPFLSHSGEMSITIPSLYILPFYRRATSSGSCGFLWAPSTLEMVRDFSSKFPSGFSFG